jgi:ADP-ribose pyrophosphatase
LRSAEILSPWSCLETISAIVPGAAQPETYHALGQPDYVNVLCLHESGSIVCVRQYRPIPDRFTLEFPGGLRDGGEDPRDTAIREIREETGLHVRELVPLIESYADVGRLTNKLYGYFAHVSGHPQRTEIGVEPDLIECRKISYLVAQGAIDVPANVALLYLATCNPRVREICTRLGLGATPWTTIAAPAE